MCVTALTLSSNVCFSQLLDTATAIGAFKKAVALAVDPVGNMYVIDAERAELLKYSADGQILARTGGYGWSPATFDRPIDVRTPNGLDVYVSDYGNHRIQRFDRNLNFISSYSTRQNEEQQIRFGYPLSVDISSVGSMFIVDGENKRIVKLTSEGAVEKTFGGIGSGAGKLVTPRKVRVAKNDRVYVLDGNTVFVFDVYGNYLGRIGGFTNLNSLTVDQQKIYFLDSCRIDTLSKDLTVRLVEDLSRLTTADEQCNIVDIQVSDKVMYALSPHRIFRMLFKHEEKK